jgi:hypothetical protein
MPLSDQGVEWTDEATGLTCIVKRSAVMGFLCGYVCVPKGHPLHGIEYSDCYAKVDTDLTFSDTLESTTQPADAWWFGFDFGRGREGRRTPADAQNVCRQLAAELSAVRP